MLALVACDKGASVAAALARERVASSCDGPAAGALWVHKKESQSNAVTPPLSLTPAIVQKLFFFVFFF